MKSENEINKSIAFIEHQGVFFQVLNEAGDDWDELATRTIYDEYIRQNPIVEKSWLSNIFG